MTGQKKGWKELEIVDGPDKWGLLVSLGEAPYHPRLRPVTMQVKSEDGIVLERDVAITALKREDASGFDWSFEGVFPGGKWLSVEGFYSISRRKGTIKVFEP